MFWYTIARAADGVKRADTIRSKREELLPGYASQINSTGRWGGVPLAPRGVTYLTWKPPSYRQAYGFNLFRFSAILKPFIYKCVWSCELFCKTFPSVPEVSVGP